MCAEIILLWLCEEKKTFNVTYMIFTLKRSVMSWSLLKLDNGYMKIITLFSQLLYVFKFHIK